MEDITHVRNQRKARKQVCPVGTGEHGGSCRPASTTSIQPPPAGAICVVEFEGNAPDIVSVRPHYGLRAKSGANARRNFASIGETPLSLPTARDTPYGRSRGDSHLCTLL